MERGRRVRAGRRAADGDAAALACRLEDALPRRLADVLDDDVRAGPPVAALTASTTSSVAWFTFTSASKRASFSSLEEVTIVLAPSALAITFAAIAMPPPMPQTSTHSPSRTPAFVTSIRYAVSKTSGKAAASSKLIPSGIG